MNILLDSFGLKRRIASALLALSGIVSLIPGLQGYATLITEAAGIIGGGGVLHSLFSRTVDTHKLASIASAIAAILAVAPTVPALAPYQVILQAALVLLGILGIKPTKTAEKVKR